MSSVMECSWLPTSLSVMDIWCELQCLSKQHFCDAYTYDDAYTMMLTMYERRTALLGRHLYFSALFWASMPLLVFTSAWNWSSLNALADHYRDDYSDILLCIIVYKLISLSLSLSLSLFLCRECNGQRRHQITLSGKELNNSFCLHYINIGRILVNLSSS